MTMPGYAYVTVLAKVGLTEGLSYAVPNLLITGRLKRLR
jgi:hypothetical protein